MKNIYIDLYRLSIVRVNEQLAKLIVWLIFKCTILHLKKVDFVFFFGLKFPVIFRKKGRLLPLEKNRNKIGWLINTLASFP